MPAPPVVGGHFGTGLGKLGAGQSNANAGATVGGAVRPTEALSAWHSLTLATAKSLPTSLFEAGRWHRAAHLKLRQRRRIR